MTKIAAGQKFATVASTVDTTERKSTTQNAKTETYTIEDLKETVLGTPDEILYTEVVISSAEILTIASVGKELLPAPGAGLYYDISKIILEFTPGSSAYVYTQELDIVSSGLVYKRIDGDLLTGGGTIAIANNIGEETVNSGSYANLYPTVDNESVILAGNTITDPTTGDGTMLVKIWYTVRTFGSEL